MKELFIKNFDHDLIFWYKKNGRDLPWRHTKNPYFIWISEIMLQQTQVDTVIDYYRRFIERFPTVNDLAAAGEDEVFKLWEGLGYYRRASNLMAAAKTIAKKYDGYFPADYDTILSLKGIGNYTASAVASIAFDIPKGVVDGNTLRIISRIYNRQDNIAKDKTKKEYQVVMDALIDRDHPSDFNQAMMDLGAMICTPKNPKCSCCPVSAYCEAHECHTEHILPVNIKPRTKNETELITAVIKYGDRYLMIKNREGLLKNLYGLIQYEVQSPAAFEDTFYENYGISVRLTAYGKLVRHVFTHSVWLMQGYLGVISENPEKIIAAHPEINLYTANELEKIAISTAHQKVMRLF